MQNAGQQYCQGGATSHQNQAANFGHSEPSNTTSNGGSTTSSLRQFRRKVEDRHQNQDNNARQIPETHVARVAPQNHYPPRTSECYRYPNQYQEYGYSVPSQVKYSEISEPPQSMHQEHVSPTSVIQKAKTNKDYMEMCNPQHVVKQPYNDLHLNNQQQTYNDATVLSQAPYISKETQAHHPLYKPESQYFPKEPQYPPQLQHQMQKYNLPQAQMRKFPSAENEFLSKLQQINPLVARSIMNDHHLQEPQKTYQPMDQNRMYPLHHNQRYMNHPSPMQSNHYPHAGYMPPQAYPNYSPSCTYSRSPQIAQPRFPSISPHDRSMSPRRSFSDGMTMSMNYPGISQKISPNYPQYNAPDFAQHYQQRRTPISQDYYQQHCRSAQYLPHQMPAQEMPEGRVTVSDSIKQYIENWADEETASEMNQMEASRFSKDVLRVREDQLPETVYTINAEYLEPLVESENGIPLVSIDPGMIRILDKNEFNEPNGERIVNVHIMESTNKPDCMLAANKPNEANQRLTSDVSFVNAERSKVVIHQNTVIQSSNTQNHDITKEQDQNGSPVQQTKVGNSLPIITDDQDPMEGLQRTIIKDCRREVVQTVDKNCSPINMEEIEALTQDKEDKPLPLSENKTENETSNIDVPASENSELLISTNGNEEHKDEPEIKDENDKINCEIDKENDVKPNEPEEESKEVENSFEVDDRNVIAEVPKEETKELVEDKNTTKDETKFKERSGKRSKRIFSVDDIINNIGRNVKKSKKDTERRHSLHSVMEFLNIEIKNSLIFDMKGTFPEKDSSLDPSESKGSPSAVDEIKDDKVKTNEETREHSKTTQYAEGRSKPDSPASPAQKNLLEECTESNQDLQIRNVIKVDEPNVLLHIAGEFVEINVSNINGKKVITVTPMSSSTSVDFNDNYETLDSNDVPGLLKFDESEIDEEENHSEVVEVENVVPEPDCVEPSSEVIIGMDLSLEEEIKLDVEQPQIICTKAAKKAYDNDLQIPSITTSEDVNNESDIYNTNDKVSSTKEKSSKDSADELEKSSKSDHEKLREFRKTKPLSKDDTVEDDEFVPFKELVKARKLKKMKLMEMKKGEEIVKADSTNKEDEIVKESVVESKGADKSSKKDKKQYSEEQIKKHKSSSTKSKSSKGTHDRGKSEKRSKEKHRSSEKGNKEKTKIERIIPVEKAPAEPDIPAEEQLHKHEATKFQQTKESVKESSESTESNENVNFPTDIAENKENPAAITDSEVKKLVDVQNEKNKISEENESTKSQTDDSSERVKPSENQEGKKKLSLQEYNSRKRKLLENKTELSTKKIVIGDSAQTFSAIRSQRPKSLDDFESLKKPKPPNVILKRKHSLGSFSVPNNFDWEETQSPKSNLDIRDKCFSEFRGLIFEKPNPKSVINQVEDKILQTYKEKVELKLSSLNIQIPKSSKCVSPEDGVLKTETSGLMQRFLKNDRLTASEMDKIRKIITYKRFMQQMKKPPITADNKIQMNRLSCTTKKKKKRFRNLYGASSSDSEDEPVETKNPNSGDYSVIQSNCLAGVVPKLIIKRKPEMPLPFVKLERLDLDLLVQEKRVCIE